MFFLVKDEPDSNLKDRPVRNLLYFGLDRRNFRSCKFNDCESALNDKLTKQNRKIIFMELVKVIDLVIKSIKITDKVFHQYQIYAPVYTPCAAAKAKHTRSRGEPHFGLRFFFLNSSP
jgi:hypothetical protein